MVVKGRTGVFYDYAGFTKKLEEPIIGPALRKEARSRKVDKCGTVVV